MWSIDDRELITLLIIAREAQQQGDDLWLAEDPDGELVLTWYPPPKNFKIIEMYKGEK